MTSVEGRTPEGAPERSPNLVKAPLRASMVRFRSAFPFSARSRLSRDCCAASRWTWWPGKRCLEFARHYNETWLVARHGYRTPARGASRSQPA